MMRKHPFEGAITDRDRARATEGVLVRCEIKLDLPRSGTLKERVSRIIQAALHHPQAIKPGDYDVVHFLYRNLPAAA
jgi:hypothetical protein